jgi:membrane protein insertase Oxa1/YidC/SpoIIIJ
VGLAVLVGISQYFTSRFTQVIQGTAPKKKKKGGDAMSPEEMQRKMSNSFIFILPLTTIFVAISAPAALSLYWVVQSFMLVGQYMILDWDKSKKGVQNLLTKLRLREKKDKKSS